MSGSLKLTNKHMKPKRKKFKIIEIEYCEYNGDIITIKSIDVFLDKNSSKSKNDSNNKSRENIIVNIINNKIPDKYYKESVKWLNLKKGIDLYIKQLCELENIHKMDNIECIHKGGRGNHYDFKIIINNSYEFLVEFKFNALCVQDTPQFVSLMKPSKYLYNCYEEYYYDNYFITLVNTYNLSLPTKEEYLKTIHSNKPPCVLEHKEKYDRGNKTHSKYSGNDIDIAFYQSSIKSSKDSISNFISNYKLKQDELTNHLLKTQKNKIYMLYKDGSFNLETINLDDYIITENYPDPEKCRYIAKTKSGKELKILLRWKNGNGIAFPSFQIS